MDTARNNRDLRNLLSISDAARYLGVSIDSLRRWDNRGILSPIRTPGGQRRYSTEQLEQFLSTRSDKKKASAVPDAFVNKDSLSPLPSQIKTIYKKGVVLLNQIASLPRYIKKASIIPLSPAPVAPLQPVKNTPSKQLLSLSFAITAGILGLSFLYPIVGKNSLPNKQEFLKIKPQESDILGITTSDLKLTGNITFNLPATFKENVVVEDKNVDLGIGELTASNVIYSLIAGSGITVSTGQTPTIASLDTLALVTGRGASTTTKLTLTGGAALGASLTFASLSSDPSSPANGDIYYNTSSNKFKCYINGSWKDCDTDTTSSGDITAVGSMTSGAAFADTTADDDWLGLGSSAGRIEFDDQSTDEVNILSALVGIGDTTPDALLDLDSSSTTGGDFLITNTGIATSGTIAGITANSVTTGDIFTISVTGLTTGDALKLTGPSSTGVISGTSDGFVSIASDVGSAGTSGVLLYLAPDFSAGSATTSYGVYNAATDSTAIGNTDYGYYGSLTLTDNAAKTGYGIYQTITDTSTTATTLYGADILVDHNAAAASGNKTLYGIRSQVTNNGITDASTGDHTLYGGYFSAIGNSGDTQTVYGVYADARSGDLNYNIYVPVVSSTDNAILIESASATLTDSQEFIYIDTASNITGNTNLKGIYVLLDNTTLSSSGTRSFTGFEQDTPGTLTVSNASGTLNHLGFNATNPNITQTAGTISAAGYRVATGGITTGGTQNGLFINSENAIDAGTLNGLLFTPPTTTNSGGTINAINIGTITTSNGTDTAISIGAGWDQTLSVTPSGTIASAAGVTWDSIDLNAATATITGSTNITTSTGFNLVNISQPTLSAASALTVTNAASFYVANAPTGGGAGPATITNAYALWVDAGTARFDGAVAFGAQATFTDSDATPDVSAGSHFITNTTAVTITDFDAGSGTLQAGHIIFVESNGTITYDCAPFASLNCGAADIVTGAKDLTVWIYDGTDWTLVNWMKNSGTQTGLDLAEMFVSSETLEAGDVVSIDPDQDARVNKSNSTYDNKLLGIVSTNPGILLQDGPSSLNSYPIALAGRVPVKVSTENGPIERGDYLTSSSTPGVAMKATRPGQIVGKALEEFKCPEPVEGPQSCQGKIVVFLNISYADPDGLLANVAFSPDGFLVSPNQTPNFPQVPVNTAQSLPDPAQDSQDLYDLTQNSDFLSLSSRVDSLAARLTTLEETVTSISAQQVIVDATSAPISPNNQTDLSSQQAIFTLLEAQEATISATLSVLGRATFSDVGITGNVNAGLITIHGLDGEIDTLAGDLKLQSSGLGGIDILAGQITIDKNGNMTSQGTIVAKVIETEKLTITSPTTASSSAVLATSIGSATILAGQTEVKIPTSAVTDKSKIFVTSQTQLESAIFVSDKNPSQGFAVSMAQSEVRDVKFDWWIVETN